MKSPSRQKGIALLTVLLVFGLAAFIARDMLLTGFTDSQRQIALRDSRQAFYYALGAEAFARELLWQDRDEDLEKGRDMDGKLDPWYSKELSFPLDEGQLRIRVQDLHGKFNLTNLRTESGGVDPLAVSQLRRLLVRIGVEPDIAYRLADWVDADEQPMARGGEDKLWLESDQPMLTGNTALAQLSEINALANLSENQYRDLSSVLTTLPERTKLNVNTVGVDVLSALVEQLSSHGASKLVARQTMKGYEEVSQALSDAGLQSGTVDSFLTTSSEYYEIEVIALYRDRIARFISVVRREPKNGKTRVVYRSQQSRLEAG